MSCGGHGCLLCFGVEIRMFLLYVARFEHDVFIERHRLMKYNGCSGKNQGTGAVRVTCPCATLSFGRLYYIPLYIRHG